MIKPNSFIFKISDQEPRVCMKATVLTTIDMDNCVQIQHPNPLVPPFYYFGSYKVCLDDGWFENEWGAWEDFSINFRVKKEQGMKIVGVNDSVQLSEMKDGDIAIITEWVFGDSVGKIVQRFQDFLIVLGQSSVKGYGRLFINPSQIDNRCYVRILPKGTQLEI